MTGGERNVLRIFVVTVALWVGALAAGDPRPVDPLIPAMATIFGGNAGAMLPVSTPPNAIVYGSGYVPMIHDPYRRRRRPGDDPADPARDGRDRFDDRTRAPVTR